MWLTFFLPQFPFCSLSLDGKAGGEKREAFLALAALKVVKESWPFRYFLPGFQNGNNCFLLYRTDTTWSTKRLVRVSVAPLKLVRPRQCTAAEDLGLVVWSCLYLKRDFTWRLMHYSSFCFYMPGLKNWV